MLAELHVYWHELSASSFYSNFRIQCCITDIFTLGLDCSSLGYGAFEEHAWSIPTREKWTSCQKPINIPGN
jgi:hypothetical protein